MGEGYPGDIHTNYYDRDAVRAQLRKELRCIRNVDMFLALASPPAELDAIRTVDYGTIPVAPSVARGAPRPSVGTWENAPLDLPPLEDAVSIQLALMDVIEVRL